MNGVTHQPIPNSDEYLEKKLELEKQCQELFVKIQKLTEKKIQTIWIEELDEFETAWNEYKNNVELDYENDRLNRKTVVKKKGSKKK